MKIDDLVSRGNNIRIILQPISTQKYELAWNIISSTREFIIAIHDGARPTSDYRDWRFSTFIPNFHAMYFELWKRTVEDEKNWYLDRAYLSIYLRIQRDEKEFLCLHCDPNISSELEEPEEKHEKVFNRKSFQLNKKYLKSKQAIKQSSSEVDKSDKLEKEKYKKGPHLHIKAADNPIPHAHFALNLGHLDAVLETIESLSEAMSYGLLMLKEEVLDRFSPQ